MEPYKTTSLNLDNRIAFQMVYVSDENCRDECFEKPKCSGKSNSKFSGNLKLSLSQIQVCKVLRTRNVAQKVGPTHSVFLISYYIFYLSIRFYAVARAVAIQGMFSVRHH